ncbi:hypothetical protein B1J94_05940 [Leptospira kirschneri serovar Grippotyphosa]|nr:hypothetical protein B1J94_05940 [Leptospira kirschneri serovar Grippotyphosa]
MGTHIKLYSTVKSWSINHFLSVTTMSFVKPDVFTSQRSVLTKDVLARRDWSLQQITKKEPVGTPAQIL